MRTKSTNFLAGKTPCWEMCHCSAMIRESCPATKHQELPCWEIEGTYGKLDDHGTTGTDKSICEACQVYTKYGEGKPIQIKLCGKGIDASLKSLKRLAKS